MNRPEVLYRGTPTKDATIFVPKEPVGPGGSPAVSATPDRVAATKFVVPGEGLKIIAGSFGEVHYYVCGDEPGFRGRDKGGAIYALSTDGFEFNPEIKIWFSPKPVVPVSKEAVNSGLASMLETGVQVFFVDSQTFKKIKAAPDQRHEILQGMISENMKQGKNIRNF